MQPVLCPICARRSLEGTLDSVTITARVDHENIAHGVRAYRCTEYNHIFFIRQADIRVAPEMGDNDTDAAATEKPNASPCPLCRGTGVDNGNVCKTCGGSGGLFPPAHALMRCPLCTRTSLERLLERVKITAKMDGQQNIAGGVFAYRCTKYRHIFLCAGGRYGNGSCGSPAKYLNRVGLLEKTELPIPKPTAHQLQEGLSYDNCSYTHAAETNKYD